MAWKSKHSPVPPKPQHCPPNPCTPLSRTAATSQQVALGDQEQTCALSTPPSLFCLQFCSSLITGI